ncbi:uncharacterized protein H6S33_007973 [Morchella sextelata]|uniref:uncharacterized protein n=1 Tax=Morchella sextelata TaxID=1174677 RepID=UPI001D059BDC|nr:uncharacterized protein H6S33_007973 [Morchella sextelata]KAH0602969.1 hypothetical protein H6S33_007973 [Morchella sextelata]
MDCDKGGGLFPCVKSARVSSFSSGGSEKIEEYEEKNGHLIPAVSLVSVQKSVLRCREISFHSYQPSSTNEIHSNTSSTMTSTTVFLHLRQINLLVVSIRAFKRTLMHEQQLRDHYMAQLAEIHIYTLEDYATVAGDDIDSPYETIAVNAAILGHRILHNMWLIKDSEDELVNLLEVNRELWIL